MGAAAGTRGSTTAGSWGLRWLTLQQVTSLPAGSRQSEAAEQLVLYLRAVAALWYHLPHLCYRYKDSAAATCAHVKTVLSALRQDDRTLVFAAFGERVLLLFLSSSFGVYPLPLMIRLRRFRRFVSYEHRRGIPTTADSTLAQDFDAPLN